MIRALLAVLWVASTLAAPLGSASGVAAGHGDPIASTALGARCSGVTYDEVRGPQLSPPRGGLRDYPADSAVCAGWWLDLPEDFVPQGLQLSGSRVFVVGHRAGMVGSKPCQVAVIDLPSGSTRAHTPRLDPPGGGAYCRHGGGAALTGAGLWVIETSRLWLLDPARIGRSGQVKRVWNLGEGVRGSTIAATRGRLVIAGYRPNGPGRARWFEESDVLRRGVTTLVETRGRPGQASMSRAPTTVPPRLQGLTFTASGKPWYVSSGIACGTLRKGGRTRDFVPGAEGIVVDGRDIWTVSEASASPYRDPSGALVPRMLRLDRDAVLAQAAAACDF